MPNKVSKVRLCEIPKHLFPIILMARLLHVSVSRFYDWLKRGVNKRLVQVA
ncbi:hypothetical protein HMP0015_0200 [Acinetobacter haemolyticus ATCC 19194]|uniref:Uncharacterized protein n=1 Tax=Acinetobacter haemolyticus ATCC 19194 TaxID=707232 RepID=D4XKF8_ACIHA|nr:hypothetical protein HMP0015_0200 [Acinetobacter haemolyticus ATCC 19194]EXE71624.1 hypothetical protein J583_3512 [Acinetobacter baumannii 83444]